LEVTECNLISIYWCRWLPWCFFIQNILVVY